MISREDTPGRDYVRSRFFNPFAPPIHSFVTSAEPPLEEPADHAPKPDLSDPVARRLQALPRYPV